MLKSDHQTEIPTLSTARCPQPAHKYQVAECPRVYLVLLLSRLWNSGDVLKSVVMIFNVGSGEGPTE